MTANMQFEQRWHIADACQFKFCPTIGHVADDAIDACSSAKGYLAGNGCVSPGGYAFFQPDFFVLMLIKSQAQRTTP